MLDTLFEKLGNHAGHKLNNAQILISNINCYVLEKINTSIEPSWYRNKLGIQRSRV